MYILLYIQHILYIIIYILVHFLQRIQTNTETIQGDKNINLTSKEKN